MSDEEKSESFIDFHQIHNEYKAGFFARLCYELNPFNERSGLSAMPEPRIVPNEVFVDAMIKNQYNIDMMEKGK